MTDGLEEHLPGIISSISVQKKDKQRYSIFVKDDFLMGVAEQTLIKFNLAKGVEITPSLYRKLQQEEGRFAIKSYFFKLLSRRDHARKELLTKALKKDYAKEVIQNVLDELEQKGFIDDAGFADKFVADKYELNKWGPAKIKSHLYKKGLSKAEIEQSIQKTFGHKDLKETLLYLVLKKKKRFLREESYIKRKKKVIDHLARKGYYSTDIYEQIDELMKAIEQ